MGHGKRSTEAALLKQKQITKETLTRKNKNPEMNWMII